MPEMLEISAAGKTWRIENPGGNIGKRMRFGDPYEANLLADIRKRRLTGSAFDIGAHVGNHSLYMAIVCGLRVYAFEGDQVLIGKLLRNIHHNPEANIAVYPYAVGDTPGWGSWYLDGRNKKLDFGTGKVPVRRIDDIADVNDLSVVKLDIEGMEPAALRGMEKHLEQRPLIYTETHTDEAMRETAAVLKPFGYQMTARFEYKGRMCRWET